jgi:vacuolar-type H+-ATPase subunit F/Vma7
MEIQKGKKVLFVGEYDTTLLFQTFGCDTLSIDNLTNEEILTRLEETIDQYGMLLLASSLVFLDQQLKKLYDLNVPLLCLPCNNADSEQSKQEFERLIDKAIGMKLNFLND